MRTSKFSEEQVIGILKKANAGEETAELCRRLEHPLAPLSLDCSRHTHLVLPSPCPYNGERCA